MLKDKLALYHPQQIIERIKLGVDRLTNKRYLRAHDPFVIQRNLSRQKVPFLKYSLIECSLQEDEENPFYTGLLNTLANHCCGTVPIPLPLIPNDALCDAVEDRFTDWAIENQVGAALREGRRTAARSGVAVLIPYKMQTDHPIKLGFQVVGAEYLKSPSFIPDIVDGIEYMPNGTDIRAVWVQEEDKAEPTRFVNSSAYSNKFKSCIVWHRKRVHKYWPECASAFQTYPSIRRYFINILKAAENQTSIPMALELDPGVYPPISGQIPTGKFEYQPGWVPTLPPGSKLSGLNFAAVAEDRSKFIDLMVGSAARCVDMPTILALADSSDSNMATAHIDLQPWKYAVQVDRFDYEMAVRRVFWLWYNLASLWPDYLPSTALKYQRPPIIFNYNEMFEHPDPQKRAKARATDLESGSSTLVNIYSQQGKNARREIQKECKLLGITTQEYFTQLMNSRNKQVTDATNKTGSESQSDQEPEEADRA